MIRAIVSPEHTLNPTPRRAVWLSNDERDELYNAITLFCLESEDETAVLTLQSVVADIGIAEARLNSNGADPTKWRLALGKRLDDTPIQLSSHELAAIQPALHYATSDNLRKLLT